MKIGDNVKSKATNKCYKVVEQKENYEGFFCEDDNGERYYFFESEVDIVQDTILDSTKPNGNDIANALITIQNDLFNCENSLELGQKYKSYSEMLSQFLLKGIENLCNKTN